MKKGWVFFEKCYDLFNFTTIPTKTQENLTPPHITKAKASAEKSALAFALFVLYSPNSKACFSFGTINQKVQYGLIRIGLFYCIALKCLMIEKSITSRSYVYL